MVKIKVTLELEDQSNYQTLIEQLKGLVQLWEDTDSGDEVSSDFDVDQVIILIEQLEPSKLTN